MMAQAHGQQPVGPRFFRKPMSQIIQHGSLEIDEDLTFQRRMWRVRPMGFAILWAILVAAVLGLFGGGLFSSARATDGTGHLRVEYERFARFQSPLVLRFRMEPPAARERQVRVWIDRRYLEAIKIESLVPEPVRSEAAEDRIVFTFDLADADRPASGAIHFQAEKIGLLRARVGLEGKAAATFNQLVFP
jgi:hypothetical protein